MKLHRVPETVTWHGALWAGRILSAIIIVVVVADGVIQLGARRLRGGPGGRDGMNRKAYTKAN